MPTITQADITERDVRLNPHAVYVLLYEGTEPYVDVSNEAAKHHNAIKLDILGGIDQMIPIKEYLRNKRVVVFDADIFTLHDVAFEYDVTLPEDGLFMIDELLRYSVEFNKGLLDESS